MERLYTKRELADILHLVMMADVFAKMGGDTCSSKTLSKIMLRAESVDFEVYMLLLSYQTTGCLDNGLLERMIDKQCSLLNTECLPNPKNKLEDFL